MVFLALGVVATLTAPCVPEATACTGFRTGIEDRFVMGKSYDWNIGWGLVVFNPVGLEKTALTLGAQDSPATWTSKYASITFDQYGCEMPNGGLNDAGLAIELMILGQTQYPPPDGRPAVNELQFIQYCLDSFASVGEMIEGAALIRISSVHAKVHYLACDVSGACAAFEFLGGKMVVSTGAAMPAPTLTNSTYDDSAEYLGQFVGFGGNEPIPQSTGSLDRFVRASALSVELAGGDVPAAAFSILESVSQGDFSKWNIVYDLEDRTLHFRTLGSLAVKTISLSQFEPGCESGRWILDIDHPQGGDTRAAFAPYTMAANQALIDKSLADIQGLPPGAKSLLAMYPDTMECIPGTAQPDPSPEPDVVSADVMGEDVEPGLPEACPDPVAADSAAAGSDERAADASAADAVPDAATGNVGQAHSKGGCDAASGPVTPSPLLLLSALLLAVSTARRLRFGTARDGSSGNGRLAARDGSSGNGRLAARSEAPARRDRASE
jgi:choloylglycine hydrolase